MILLAPDLLSICHYKTHPPDMWVVGDASVDPWALDRGIESYIPLYILHRCVRWTDLNSHVDEVTGRTRSRGTGMRERFSDAYLPQFCPSGTISTS